MKPTIRNRDLLYGAMGSMLLALVLFAGIQFTGCAAATPANAHQTVTEIVAGAGAAANTAEAQYASGAIAQTPANRTAINALGAAYNDARAAFLVVLRAEGTYTQALNAQIGVCAPGAPPTSINGQPLTCAAASASVTAAQTALATANSALTAKTSALSTATVAVNAIPKK